MMFSTGFSPLTDRNKPAVWAATPREAGWILPSTARFLNGEAFTHRSFTHSKLSHTASVYTQNTYTQCFYTWQAFIHTASFLNREAFTHRSFYTQQAFTHSKRLHTEHLHTVLLHMASIYTHRNFYTETLLHTEAFTHSKLLNTKSFTHSKLLQKKVFTQRKFLAHNHNRDWSSKTGSRRQSEKKTILKHFLKGLLKWKLLTPKLRKSADKSLSQPWCSHSNTIYEIQLHMAQDNNITHAAAAPSNLDAATTMRSVETELQNTIELRATVSEIAAPKPDAKAEKRRFWNTF